MPTPPYSQRPDGSWVDALGAPVSQATATSTGSWGNSGGTWGGVSADQGKPLTAAPAPVRATSQGAGGALSTMPATPGRHAVDTSGTGPIATQTAAETETHPSGAKRNRSTGQWFDANGNPLSDPVAIKLLENEYKNRNASLSRGDGDPWNPGYGGANDPNTIPNQINRGLDRFGTTSGTAGAGVSPYTTTPGVTGGVQPVSVPASTIQGTNLGPALQVANTMVGQAPGVGTTTVGQAGNISGNSFQAAQVAPVGNVTATQIGPASLGSQERVAAAMVQPTKVAETARVGNTIVGAPSIAPVERARAAAAGTTMLNQTDQRQMRDTQLRLLDSLQQRADGTAGPSAAELELQRATEREKAQQIGLARATAGATNAGFAAKQAAEATQTIGQEAAGQAAALRLKDQEAARAAIGGTVAQAREGDLAVATKQAEIQNQVALANAQLEQQAGLTNVGTSKDLALKGADLTITADLANQDNALKANLANQGVEAARHLADATLGQQGQIANQSAGLDAAKSNQATRLAQTTKDAELLQGANLANQDTATRVALANQSTAKDVAIQNAQLAQQSFQYKATTEFEAAKANQLTQQQTLVEQARISADRQKQESAQKLAVLQQQADINAKKGIVDAQLGTEIQKAQAELAQRTQEFNAKQLQEVAMKYSTDSLAAMTENERNRITQQTETLKAQLVREGYDLEALKAKMTFMLAQQGLSMQAEKDNDAMNMAYMGMLMDLWGNAFSVGGMMGGK